MHALPATSAGAMAFLEAVAALHARYRRGEIKVAVPAALLGEEPLDDLIAKCLPASHALLEAAARSLFYSLPVAFDPSESIGPFLATVDRDEQGQPYRFLDMGAGIATQAFGENDPAVVEAVLAGLPYAASRYAHSEYQTALSLRLKAALDRIAPTGTPRHFVVNTGAEAVENAIKASLLHRVRTSGEKDGGFIVSFEGAFHGRTLGSLAVTHRKKARLGFPTFDWPHVSFPVQDGAARATAQREERSLKQVWDLLVSGRLPHAEKSKDLFRRELDAIDAFLGAPGGEREPGDGSPARQSGDLAAFVALQRAALDPDVVRRSQRVAGVLVEPIQGEGGVRRTSARFMQRLRLLTLVYDVPLMFDEVQTGWGATGRLWAHELFELPAPPDIVVWAKKAQNGVLFVSEELATFFQEEKKFNTTWEGEPVGMLRLLALLDRLDLAQVRATGAHARAGLEALARDFPRLVKNVRGEGVMLAFDVVRADWRDALRERAFRRGLLLLPAGERTLRVYPRYDTELSVLDEALAILRRAVEDIRRSGSAPPANAGPELRVGCLECPLEALEVLDVDPVRFRSVGGEILAVEVERYGSLTQYPPDVLKDGRRPMLQFPRALLEATLANPRGLCVALRDTISGRIVAYALGSALEDHDEEGVGADSHLGEGNTFYLQALAVLPSVRNRSELQNHLIELLRARAASAGFSWLSTLVEASTHAGGPAWLAAAPVLLTHDDYLGSGIRFVYVAAEIGPAARAPSPTGQAGGQAGAAPVATPGEPRHA